MRSLPPSLRRLPLVGALLLAGCDRGAADLVREIDAAREGCTEERLRAGDEECVRMMERYAEMGSEAMETYIGAVKSLDRALQRMPPAQFDTAGLGHAISPALRARLGDPAAAARGLYPGWSVPAYPPPFRGGRMPREDPYDPANLYPDGEYPYSDEAYPYPDETSPDPGGYRYPGGDPGYGDPERGRLLPPEQRLRRPWLEGERPRGVRPDTYRIR